MDLKDWARRLTKKKAAVTKKPYDPQDPDTFPGVRRLDAAEELERRREINARGASIRAERAALVDALLGGRGRWLARRPDWLGQRWRERW